MVLYVGDKPSRKNTNPDLAFVGTKSGETLKKWHKIIAPDMKWYKAVNTTSDDFQQIVREADLNDMPIIALGNNAATALLKMKVEHYKLPHPSGRNRLLNDKDWLADRLEGARIYVWCFYE